MSTPLQIMTADLEDVVLHSRKELLPWHYTNVGREIFEVKRWELLNALEILDPEREQKVLCLGDGIGLCSFLLSIHSRVTYHNTKDLYEFSRPVQKCICSLETLATNPPEGCSAYQRVLGLSINWPRPLAALGLLLDAVRRVLLPDGTAVVSVMWDPSGTIRRRDLAVSNGLLERCIRERRLYEVWRQACPAELVGGRQVRLLLLKLRSEEQQ